MVNQGLSPRQRVEINRKKALALRKRAKVCGSKFMEGGGSMGEIRTGEWKIKIKACVTGVFVYVGNKSTTS